MKNTTTDFLFKPAEPGYEQAVGAYNLAAPLQPEMAGTVTRTDEVRAALALARELGTGVRVHATGHAAGAQAPYKGEILLRTRLDTAPSVDLDNATATIPAGTTWAEVVELAAPHGLAPLHGSSGTVGAIGYLLGGGMSFYGRLHGLAANSILSLTVMLADGSVVTVDAENDPELFWALRGGGGGLGVVLSATVSLIRVPSVYTGAAFWPIEAADALLTHWEEWGVDAPENASTSFRIMNLPPLPGVPPQLTGGPVVCVDGAVLDTAQTGALRVAADLLDPLREISAPLLDTWHLGGPAEVLATHMDPPDPVPATSDHMLLGELGAEGRAAFLEAAKTAPLAVVELRQLGGAMAEPRRSGGAVDRFRGAYAYLGVGIIAEPGDADVVGKALSSLRASVGAWDTGFTAPTFVETYGNPQRTFETPVAERVRSVRERVDPEGLFRSDATPGSIGS